MELRVETFTLLPKWIRTLISLLLALIAGVNVLAFVYIFFIYDILFHSNPPEIEIILSLSLAQITSIMLIGWVYLRFSWSQVSRKTLMKQVSNFLEEDICLALSNIHYYYEDGKRVSDIHVESMDHQKGTTSAYYKVVSRKWGSLVLYIQVNIKIIEVIYHLEPAPERTLRYDEDVKNSVEGAKTVGWKATPYCIKPYSGPSDFWPTQSCEMIMMKQVVEDDMFLLNTPKRIFWANDIAMMTKSFLSEAGIQCG